MGAGAVPVHVSACAGSNVMEASCSSGDRVLAVALRTRSSTAGDSLPEAKAVTSEPSRLIVVLLLIVSKTSAGQYRHRSRGSL